MDNDLVEKLEARIVALEKAAGHCADPDDRRLDNLLRKVARSIELTLWLGGGLIKVAPFIAAVWFLGEDAWHWFLNKVGVGQ